MFEERIGLWERSGMRLRLLEGTLHEYTFKLLKTTDLKVNRQSMAQTLAIYVYKSGVLGGRGWGNQDTTDR